MNMPDICNNIIECNPIAITEPKNFSCNHTPNWCNVYYEYDRDDDDENMYLSNGNEKIFFHLFSFYSNILSFQKCYIVSVHIVKIKMYRNEILYLRKMSKKYVL